MSVTNGVVVNVLTQHVTDLGLSPSWIQFFSVNHTGVERNIYICQISCYLFGLFLHGWLPV